MSGLEWIEDEISGDIKAEGNGCQYWISDGLNTARLIQITIDPAGPNESFFTLGSTSECILYAGVLERDKRIADLVREIQTSNDMFDKAWQVISEASEEGHCDQLREYAEKVRGL